MMRTRKNYPALKHILPLLALLAFSCSPGGGLDSVFDPGTDSSGGNSTFQPGRDRLNLDITLEVKQGQGPDMPAGTMLADVKDGTTTDSNNLYIDVSIDNAGADHVYLPTEVQELALNARVNFVDLPYKKNFSHGKLKLVIGWTDGGLQLSEVNEWEFDTDSTLVFSMPLTRADSFNIADNVAIYGLELADNRFIHAARIVVIASDQPVPDDEPDMVGYVERVDTDIDRLYVSGATVVVADSTIILDSDSTQIALDNLQTGTNELTITGLAWGYADFIGLTANGWEFRRFEVVVARPIP